MESPTIARLAAPPVLKLGGGSWQDYVYEGRPYFVYRPANYHVGTAVPLVMMLHGCVQSPSSLAYDTQMNQLADQQQFLVVYPQHLDLNPGHFHLLLGWNFFFEGNQHRDSGEAGSLAGIVRDMLGDHSRWTIDERRIYVAGISAGAAMAVILGATYPDLFAAIGVHAGLEYQWARLPSPPLLRELPSEGDEAQGAVAIEPASDAKLLFHGGFLAVMDPGPDPIEQGQKAYEAMGPFARVVPTIVFHGTADQMVAPLNGQQVVRQWLYTNHLASQGTFTADFEHPSSKHRHAPHGWRRYTVSTWKDASGHDIVAYWVVEGMGHAWSGGMPDRPFTDPQGPNATRATYEFFMAHTHE